METSSLLHTFVTVICLMTGWLADYGNAQLVNCKASDRETLIDFKSGLVDPKNLLSSWEGSNCCQWWGVGCNNWTGDVIVVDIHNPDKVPESCGLRGEIRSSLANLSSLEYLDLSFNAFIHNQIPIFFQSFKKLQYLNLAYAGFDGKIPPNLGNISTLQHVDISSLAFSTNLAADDIRWVTGLTALKYLAMDRVDLSMVGSNWVEAFNMLPYLSDLHLSACNLPSPPSFLNFTNFSSLAVLDLSHNIFHSFPQWLVNVSSLMYIDLSFNSIWDSIPVGFTKLPNLRFLNLWGNGLTASTYQLFEESWSKIEVIQLGFNFVQGNSIEGNIPNSIFKLCSLEYLDLSYNNLTGSLPEHLEGTKYYLYESPLPHLQNLVLTRTRLVASVIDLSRNTLTGSIPKSIGNCLYLEVLDLQNNNLSGKIPRSLGQLSDLQTLHLRDNIITGKLPSSFKGLWSLETLDLGYNRLIGKIPQWPGDAFPHLKVLSLRSNAFSGKIPSALLNLTSLKILDLAENQLSGSIPPGMSNLNAMTQEQNIKQDLIYGWVAGVYYEENVIVNTKGQSLEYTRTLSFLTCIDLSGNYLHGEFPHEVTKLAGLVVLNLSRNQISGQIPQSISELHQLASLDLSCNMFSGPIPSSIISMSFLEFLNVSYNNFSGRIPYAGQMSTFEASSFSGNPGLCGAPLAVECSDSGPSIPGLNGEIDYGDGYIVDKWLYLAIGLGFAAGVLIPYLLMAFKRTWSYMYFDSVDKVADALLYLGCKTSACFRNHCYHRR
uniref:Leucine-rich repeat-containing N-terminal plant-type domain-containing protein n=1 Tax=Manihot esculenta TaxID=3983 RepID=A0A2C9VKZ8_MANES